LVALGVIVWATWSIAPGLAVLKATVPLILIWFPYFVDDVTYGTWAHGYRIDSHTPAFLIAAVGWVLLLLELVIVVDPYAISQFFLGN